MSRSHSIQHRSRDVFGKEKSHLKETLLAYTADSLALHLAACEDRKDLTKL